MDKGSNPVSGATFKKTPKIRYFTQNSKIYFSTFLRHLCTTTDVTTARNSIKDTA